MKRIILIFAATTAALTFPASAAFANHVPPVLPEEGCFGVYPAYVQPLFCGEGPGGVGHGQSPEPT